MFEKIKKLCEEHHISIWALEKALGFGNGTIGKWKNSSPAIANVEKVAKYFNVTTDYLLK